MMRTVESPTIPCVSVRSVLRQRSGFFSSPDLDFAGRVHTNGDLYLGVANGNTLTFHDKITAYGEVIRRKLPNGLDASSNNDSGTVDILNAAQGCDSSPRSCRPMGQDEGCLKPDQALLITRALPLRGIPFPPSCTTTGLSMEIGARDRAQV